MTTMKPDALFNEEKTDLSATIFMNILDFRKQGSIADLPCLRETFRRQLNEYRKRCLNYNVPSHDITKAMYALVAFIDETALNVPCSEREIWASNPLQFEFFGEYIAGSKFYILLESMLADCPSDSSEVLSTFFLCLVLGFKGKYTNDKEGIRESLIERTGRKLRLLNQRQTVLISPDLVCKKSVHLQKGWQKLPVWLFYSIGIIIFLVITFTMKIIYYNSASSFIHILKSVSP